MRSNDSSARVPVVHRLVNAAAAPPQRTTATGNCRRYCAENAPMEKRFSPVDLLASHALDMRDRKSTRLNSSHSQISYAVFCLKKKKITMEHIQMQPRSL